MSAEDLDRAIERWILDRPNKAQRFWRWSRSYYFNKLPRQFRPLGVAHWASKTSVASSAPFLAYFYGSIAGWMAFAGSAAIFGGHSLVSLLDRASRDKRSPTGDASTEIIIRLGELLGAVKPRSTPAGQRDDAIRSALGIIEVFARQVTGCEKGELSVAIALYTGESSHRMCIKHRNPGNTRPMGRKFDGGGVLGHHACKAGSQPRVVHDIRGLGKELQRSPTQSEVGYRSFLILPLVVTRSEGQRIGGFLSIDSTRPYSFFGKRAKVVVVNCQPVIEHIQDLI